MDSQSASQRMRAARKARGWTAGQLAARAMEVAAEQGEQIQITQQTVSFFERGRTKSLPRWYRYATAALAPDLADDRPTDVSPHATYGQPQMVMLPVAFPPEFALADMLFGMMRSMPDLMDPLSESRQIEIARELATLLPSVLARVRGPFRSERSAHDDAAGDEAEALRGGPQAQRRA